LAIRLSPVQQSTACSRRLLQCAFPYTGLEYPAFFAVATALGAAYAAGLAVGFFKNLDELCAN
jgi:hypothetical protein